MDQTPSPVLGDGPTASSSSPVPPNIKKPAVQSSSAPVVQHHPPAFRVDLKYRNQLPDLPFDPKFLDLPVLDSNFLWAFNSQLGGSSLERNYKYRIHMNPPQLNDDLVDVLGNEEWARCTELDERDRNLLRKDGQSALHASSSSGGAAANARHNRQSVTKRSWMLKTYYTQDNVYVADKARASLLAAGSSSQGDDDAGGGAMEDEDEDEEVFKLVGKIERQFQHAKQMQQSGQVPGSTKRVRRVLPLLPHRTLRELDLHLVRFKVGETTGLEQHDVAAPPTAVLAKRKEPGAEQGDYSPLALLVGRAKKTSAGGKEQQEEEDDDDNDDDLFADEDDDEDGANKAGGGAGGSLKQQQEEVHHLRDYQVHAMSQPKRFALFIDSAAAAATQDAAPPPQQAVARFVELHDDALKLLRLANDANLRRRRRSKDEDDEDDDENEDEDVEAHVKLHVRKQLAQHELVARRRHRAKIEGAGSDDEDEEDNE